MHSILLPLDGSPLAERVLPEVRRLALRKECEIILVRAVVPPPVENSIMALDAMLSAAREYLLDVRDRLAREGFRVRAVIRPGSAVGVILEVAEEENATLLALATHGETGLKRLLVGSVAEDLLRRSPIPMYVIRPFWSVELLPSPKDRPELRAIRNILLPLDESDRSLVLLPFITEFARQFDSRVVLLRAQSDKARSEAEGVEQDAEDDAVLRVFARRFERKGIKTLSIAGTGKPVDEILEVARHHEIDLIAMATHGRTGISRLVEGSVTEAVLRKSTCPLFVVRAPATVRRSRQPSSVGP